MIADLTRSAKKVGHALARWNEERCFSGQQVGTQFKAEVDLRADELWRKELSVIAPDLPVVSEEDESSQGAPPSGAYWLIDPIDGTSSFVGGFRGWVTQVALMENHRPVMAAVFAPLLDQMFHAESGLGTYLNGHRLTLQPTGAATSLIDNYPEPRGIAAAVMHHFNLSRYVESGSIGLKICRIAAAHADVFVKDVQVKNWDVAPGDLILTEAGGAIARLDGTYFVYDQGLDHSGIIAATAAKILPEISNWAKSHQSSMPS